MSLSPAAILYNSSGIAIATATTTPGGADIGLVVRTAGTVEIGGTITSITNPVAVTGTFWQATQPVSSVQLPAALGQAAMLGSLPVVIASDQSAIPITGTLAVTQSGSWVINSITNPVAATQSGSWTVNQGGTWNIGTVTAVTSITNPVAATQSGLWNIGTVTAVTSITNPVAVTGTFWQATQPISAASLPLPTGAATEATLATIPLAQGVALAGTKGVMLMGLYPSGTPAYSAGTINPLRTTASGQLYATNGSLWAFGIDYTGSIPAMAGAVATTSPPSWANNNAAYLNVDLNGALRTTAVATGNKTNDNAAPAADNIGALTALATENAPTYTEGRLVLPSAALNGHLRVLAHVCSPADEDHQQRVSNNAQAFVAELVRQVGPSFSGSTVDTNFWTATPTGTGTVTQSGNGSMTLTTGATAGSTAVVSSVRKGRAVAGLPQLARFVVSHTYANTGTVRFAVYDGANGLGFVIRASDGRLGVCYRTATDVAWNDQYTLNGNYGTSKTWVNGLEVLEIQYDAEENTWYLNGELLHEIYPTSAPLTATRTLNLYAYIDNGANAVSYSTTLLTMSIFRIGSAVVLPANARLASNATTVLRRGAGILHKVTVTSPSNGNSITFYDNTAGSGTILCILKLDTAGSYDLGAIPFYTGLTAVQSGGSAGEAVVLYDP